MWMALGIISVICLIIFWFSRNAVWGGATIGVIIGFILSTLSAIRGNHFHWSMISKAAIVGCLIGVATELFCKITNRKN